MEAGEGILTVCEVLVNKKLHSVEILERNANGFLIEINDKFVNIRLTNSFQGKTVVEIDGQILQVKVKRVQEKMFQIEIGGNLFEVQISPPKIFKEPIAKLEPLAAVARKPMTAAKIEKDAVTAPIAGRIVLVKGRVGQSVEKGECVCILEAMKMENEVVAPKAGVLKEVRISEGAVVNKGDVLAIIA
jgi:biotin carboxyl carrier protein